jgi:hypothetical protein
MNKRGKLMSTDYRLITPILACDLFDGRLEEFGVCEHFSDTTTDRERLLTDGRNYLWLYVDGAGFVAGLTRYLPNGVPSKILNAIAEAFDTEIVSEHEPQFWGFETHEEWDAWNQKIHKEYEDKYHDEMMKFLGGEPNDIRPGTIGMLKAEIAKTLIESDPTLLLTANKDKLRSEIELIYERDHVISVKLSPQDLAAVTMRTTHEDDLPRA